MDVALKEKSEVWRGRGHPRREIPAQVRQLADATYRTGKVGAVSIGADDEEEATELVRLLKSYAKSRNLVMRIQRDDDELRFEMADRPSGKQEA
jgi:hypothetical protein